MELKNEYEKRLLELEKQLGMNEDLIKADEDFVIWLVSNGKVDCVEEDNKITSTITLSNGYKLSETLPVETDVLETIIAVSALLTLRLAILDSYRMNINEDMLYFKYQTETHDKTRKNVTQKVEPEKDNAENSSEKGCSCGGFCHGDGTWCKKREQ